MALIDKQLSEIHKDCKPNCVHEELSNELMKECDNSAYLGELLTAFGAGSAAMACLSENYEAFVESQLLLAKRLIAVSFVRGYLIGQHRLMNKELEKLDAKF
jgi:hypothetical protein